MTLKISSELLAGIQREAAGAEPDEACGLLFGNETAVTSWLLARNVADDRQTHFEIDPAALFGALRAERAGGDAVLGYWHSHPSGDVRPSARDAEAAAVDGKIWMIVAQSDVATWRLSVSPEFDQVPDGPVSNQRAEIPSMSKRATCARFERVPLITGNVFHLRPLNAHDTSVVPLLVAAGYPAIAPIVDELIAWTADPSWPVAEPLAEFLATIGDPIVAALSSSLKQIDGRDDRNRFSMIMSRLPVSALIELTSEGGAARDYRGGKDGMGAN